MTAGDAEPSGMQPATYVALSGGVGGAKLSLGLAHLLGEQLTIIVNTGDDFEHLGLHISPDIDTAFYTLAGLVNVETGWGRRDETWSFMSVVTGLGGPDWFRLGDGDLAMHVERSRRLRAGEALSDICAHVRKCLGIAAQVLPMSDDPVRTIVDTDAGRLAFQEYFVREQCRPQVRTIHFEGAVMARAQPRCIDALTAPTLAGVIICPSNPYLSVDPILAIPGMAAAIKACRAPVIAVTPIVGGRAIKGPAAKIMKELGLTCDVATVTRHYEGWIDGFVLDAQDAGCEAHLPVPALVTNTIMQTLDDKITLAAQCLAFCGRRPRSRPQ
jgi:LPPG:FO 2-phospho-L-lactate transferase